MTDQGKGFFNEFFDDIRENDVALHLAIDMHNKAGDADWSDEKLDKVMKEQPQELLTLAKQCRMWIDMSEKAFEHEHADRLNTMLARVQKRLTALGIEEVRPKS